MNQVVRRDQGNIGAGPQQANVRSHILTVGLFCERNPSFSQPAMRNLIWKAEERYSSKGEIPGNGLLEAGAILRVGRKVLIDEERFFEWVRKQNEVRT